MTVFVNEIPFAIKLYSSIPFTETPTVFKPFFK